ncbi:MAG: DcaP family trimeric outer membrane transporter [Phenylobacterium sp.]
MKSGTRRLKPELLALTALGSLSAGAAQAQDSPKFEIYGFAQLDYVQDFNRVDPDWDATLRPSKIPTTEGIFGDDGQAILSVRQSRFGVKMNQDIAGRPLNIKFEFDLYGTGDDAGQTTFRLRHFFGEWGPILAGQTNSVFMDIDTFPNTVDYWGPNGMVFLRNPQIRYTYKTGGHEFAVAIEQPGNDIDPGNVRELDPGIGSNIQGDEEVPDLTAHWRYTGGWGHVQLAGILRRVAYETAGTPGNDPSGSETGWGVNATSNVKTWGKDVLHLGVVYGEGIASYMNDGGTDMGPQIRPGIVQPIAGAPPPAGSITGEVVPLLGLVVWYDHYWNDAWATSLGWSQVEVDNTNFQSGSAFESAQYAAINLLWTPDPKLLFGAELLWGNREDFNGASGDDTRLQFTAKYSFSSTDFFR